MVGGYMNKKQLAAYLNVSVATIRMLVNSGSLPKPLVISERIQRWKREDVDAYLTYKPEPARPDMDQEDTIGDMPF